MMPNNISNEKGRCCWDIATKEDINRYYRLLDEMLDTINIPECVRCNECVIVIYLNTNTA